jgi:hypothetical protein
MVAPFILAAAAFQHALFASPNHFLMTAARQAEAARSAVLTSGVVDGTRPILLLSGFLGYGTVWTFSTTMSRLGAFFYVNFDIPRDRLRRFTPRALNGDEVVLADLFYLPGSPFDTPVVQMSVDRELSLPVPVAWEAEGWFPCLPGDVLGITAHRPTPTPDDSQYVRVLFDRPERQAFKIIDVFGRYLDLEVSPRGGVESTVFALVRRARSRGAG